MLHGFVLITHTSDKFMGHAPKLNSQFICPATGRAADLVGGLVGGLASLQTTEQPVAVQQHDKKFLRILR